MTHITEGHPILPTDRGILLGTEPWSAGALSFAPHIVLPSKTGVAVGPSILATHGGVYFKTDFAWT